MSIDLFWFEEFQETQFDSSVAAESMPRMKLKDNKIIYENVSKLSRMNMTPY